MQSRSSFKFYLKFNYLEILLNLHFNYFYKYYFSYHNYDLCRNLINIFNLKYFILLKTALNTHLLLI
jgi:hypothetical protein